MYVYIYIYIYIYTHLRMTSSMQVKPLDRVSKRAINLSHDIHDAEIQLANPNSRTVDITWFTFWRLSKSMSRSHENLRDSPKNSFVAELLVVEILTVHHLHTMAPLFFFPSKVRTALEVVDRVLAL